MKTNALRKKVPSFPEPAPTDNLMDRLADFCTDRTCSQLWITPENKMVHQPHCFRNEFFRDPAVAQNYGVAFADDESTRFAALNAGFVRIKYRFNGGFAIMETFRWDRPLRELIDRWIMENEASLDLVRICKMDRNALPVQVGAVSLFHLRLVGKRITKQTLDAWNNFRETKI
jgi:hypothetical protein